MSTTGVFARTCGTCTMCCKLLGVSELSKPRNTWCTNCEIGKGCSIYPDRPSSCAGFECAWLLGVLPEDERPDKTKVVAFMLADSEDLQVHVDPHHPEAHHTGAIARVIKAFAESEHSAFIVIGEKRTVFCRTDRKPDVLKLQEAMEKCNTPIN